MLLNNSKYIQNNLKTQYSKYQLMQLYYMFVKHTNDHVVVEWNVERHHDRTKSHTC